jgi:hypothetical protein
MQTEEAHMANQNSHPEQPLTMNRRQLLATALPLTLIRKALPALVDWKKSERMEAVYNA